jgi:hypothetical protein
MGEAAESDDAKTMIAAGPMQKPAQAATYNLVGVALAAAGAIAFSLRAIFVKLAYEDMSDPVTLLALQRRGHRQARIDPLHDLGHCRRQRLLHRPVPYVAAAERAGPAAARL